MPLYDHWPKFLRFAASYTINASPLSRVNLVKELWIGVNNEARHTGYNLYTTLHARQHRFSAFILIDIPASFRPRLRIDSPSNCLTTIPFSLLVSTIAGYITVLSPRRPDDVPPPATTPSPGSRADSPDSPGRVASCSYTVMARASRALCRLPSVLLERLPRSLAELDMYRRPPIDLPSPMVSEVGAYGRPWTTDKDIRGRRDGRLPDDLSPQSCAHQQGYICATALMHNHCRVHVKLPWQSEHRATHDAR